MGDVTIVAEQLRRRVPGGIGTYVRGLLLGLHAMGSDAPGILLAASRSPARPDPLADLGYPVHASGLPAPVLTRLWDRRLFSAVDGDVMHATSFAAPRPRRMPVTVMVHDVAWRDVPDAYPPHGRRWHQAALSRWERDAAVLVTPSAHTAARLDARRVEVIPEGCDHLPAPDQAGCEHLLRSLGVVTPYLLSVSTLEPRKNLTTLLEAYTRARPSLPEPWPLVVAGAAGWGPTLEPTPNVKLAGPVTGAVLAALYAGARCFAYVPVIEGWGLPPTEAMAACVPVVATPMPSTGGASLEVDPHDVAGIADALVVAASDDRRRSELVTAGLMRARDLTWESAARRHAEVWESLR
jgi:glycosyltransferase involved in cell wall biosynthesis